MSGLRGEESIAVLCRHEGIAEGLYYSWSEGFLEAGKKRLGGDTGLQEIWSSRPSNINLARNALRSNTKICPFQ